MNYIVTQSKNSDLMLHPHVEISLLSVRQP